VLSLDPDFVVKSRRRYTHTNSCMTAIELALQERGYQQCANNIHSISGSLWTPEGAGLTYERAPLRAWNANVFKLVGLVCPAKFCNRPRF
jgi:hypothetical protein